MHHLLKACNAAILTAALRHQAIIAVALSASNHVLSGRGVDARPGSNECAVSRPIVLERDQLWINPTIEPYRLTDISNRNYAYN